MKKRARRTSGKPSKNIDQRLAWATFERWGKELARSHERERADLQRMADRYRVATGAEMPDLGDRQSWAVRAMASGYVGDLVPEKVWAWEVARAERNETADWSQPMSLADLANRLDNITPKKAKTLLKPYGLRHEPPGNRQSWTVRLDMMPGDMREKLTRR